MQKITLIVNGAPYGTEGPYNALRLTTALLAGEDKDKPDVRLFLMSDSIFSAKRAGCAEGVLQCRGYAVGGHRKGRGRQALRDLLPGTGDFTGGTNRRRNRFWKATR
jgi:hypothetical protein